jgi:hypothetical protein
MNDKEKKAYQKAYQIEYQIEYRKTHLEKSRLYQANFRKTNDEQIRAKRKELTEQIKMKAYNSIYYRQHEKKIKAVTVCECGGKYQHYYQKQHNTSLRHIAYCELITSKLI